MNINIAIITPSLVYNGASRYLNDVNSVFTYSRLIFDVILGMIELPSINTQHDILKYIDLSIRGHKIGVGLWNASSIGCVSNAIDEDIAKFLYFGIL